MWNRAAQACFLVQEPRLGAIGNYVWLDEDGDGDQDAGEAGIPNVQVVLTGTYTPATLILTTYTDANGGYLFADLPPGNRCGRIPSPTPPAGLNQTYDEKRPASQHRVTMVTWLPARST